LLHDGWQWRCGHWLKVSGRWHWKNNRWIPGKANIEFPLDGNTDDHSKERDAESLPMDGWQWRCGHWMNSRWIRGNEQFEIPLDVTTDDRGREQGDATRRDEAPPGATTA